MRSLVNCKQEQKNTRVGPNCDPHREEKEKKMQANYKKLMNFYRNRIVPTYKEIDEYAFKMGKVQLHLYQMEHLIIHY